MKKIVFIIFMLAFFFVSCDYPGLIEFVNKTNNVAYFNVYRDYGNKKDTLNVEISNFDKIPNIWLGYGHSWNKKNITNFIKHINKLELISENDTLVFTDKNEMFIYLKNHRKGIFNNIIRIEVK